MWHHFVVVQSLIFIQQFIQLLHSLRCCRKVGAMEVQLSKWFYSSAQREGFFNIAYSMSYIFGRLMFQEQIEQYCTNFSASYKASEFCKQIAPCSPQHLRPYHNKITLNIISTEDTLDQVRIMYWFLVFTRKVRSKCLMQFRAGETCKLSEICWILHFACIALKGIVLFWWWQVEMVFTLFVCTQQESP